MKTRIVKAKGNMTIVTHPVSLPKPISQDTKVLTNKGDRKKLGALIDKKPI